jgi:HEAT repeat protein
MIQRPRVYMSAAPQGCRLEPPTDLLVLARADAGRIIELRAHGVDCDLNASGMPVVWLTGVSPDASVAWLTSIAVPKDDARAAPANPLVTRNDVARSALAAAALHAAPSAARMLIDLASNGATPELRGRALVYLGQRASDKAASDAIVTAIDGDPDREVRRRAVQALSQLPGGEGVPLLIDLARTHRDADVRRQAMRYLGQSRDPRALQFFTQVLLKD